MTTSIPPEAPLLPPAIGPGEERVFEAPWEARSFALVVALHRTGVFPWPAFADALAAEIRRGGTAPDPASGTSSAYYRQWLAAAERLLGAHGIIDEAAIQARAKAIGEELAQQHAHD
jgi:nitrile hydratase accessory protein